MNKRVIDGSAEMINEEDTTDLANRPSEELEESRSKAIVHGSHPDHRSHALMTYVLLPLIFLTVTLIGGLRLTSPDNAFVFLKPPLICLVFASVLLVLFFRAGPVHLDGWFSDRLSVLKNVANAAVVLTLFSASTQVFNSLLPEQGLPFWVIGFCFLWTLWNNIFSTFDTQKLLRSLGALFGLAFVVKYLVLANLTANGDASWLQRIWQDPSKEAFTWLLDLPRYSNGTGYIQFFALALFLIGLFLTPQRTDR
jgi:hypothetical protein